MKHFRKILSADQINDYVQLTYLTKIEILCLFKLFYQLAPEKISEHFLYRVPATKICEAFPEIKFNPFRDRIISVFSSQKDEHFSFEDLLDFGSAMSENCPLKVKANWAFNLFDFDFDGNITRADIFQIIDHLTDNLKLTDEEKNHISDVLLEEMDLGHSGGMNHLEFLHTLTKLPEFVQCFSFKIL